MESKKMLLEGYKIKGLQFLIDISIQNLHLVLGLSTFGSNKVLMEMVLQAWHTFPLEVSLVFLGSNIQAQPCLTFNISCF